MIFVALGFRYKNIHLFTKVDRTKSHLFGGKNMLSTSSLIISNHFIYVWLYACVCVRTCVCVYVCIYACMHACV